MILEQKYKNEILSIMSNYKKIHSLLDSYSKILGNSKAEFRNGLELCSMQTRIQSLISELGEERRKEKLLLETIASVYGEGRLDPLTFEYNIVSSKSTDI